jgi:feruloyl-CoA synthase
MMRQVWAFLDDERPLVVDWLPWSKAFGGNHNVYMALTNGGTMYIDAGRPTPDRFGQTIANLADVPPTVYFNVPAGYAALVPALEADAAFAGRFFSRLRLASSPGRGRWTGGRSAFASAAVRRPPEAGRHACPRNLPSLVAAGTRPNC